LKNGTFMHPSLEAGHSSKTLYTVSRKPLHIPRTRWDTLAQ
jgi:hypothetical protein